MSGRYAVVIWIGCYAFRSFPGLRAAKRPANPAYTLPVSGEVMLKVSSKLILEKGRWALGKQRCDRAEGDVCFSRFDGLSANSQRTPFGLYAGARGRRSGP